MVVLAYESFAPMRAMMMAVKVARMCLLWGREEDKCANFSGEHKKEGRKSHRRVIIYLSDLISGWIIFYIPLWFTDHMHDTNTKI